LTAFANAYAERFVRTVKENCLEQMIFFGEDSLRNGIREFIAHLSRRKKSSRPGNRLIAPVERIDAKTGTIRRRQRLGGMLNYYYRDAA
jgi:putative transposase